MKYSLDITSFLEEISSLSHSTLFFYVFALIDPLGQGQGYRSLGYNKYIFEGVGHPRRTHVDWLYCAVLSHSVTSDSATSWTVAHQAPVSMGILQARILKWVAILSSRGSSQPRDQTQVSCIAGRFFTSWATSEAQLYCGWHQNLTSRLRKKCLWWL